MSIGGRKSTIKELEDEKIVVVDTLNKLLKIPKHHGGIQEVREIVQDLLNYLKG